jgi:hypothetical protein
VPSAIGKSKYKDKKSLKPKREKKDRIGNIIGSIFLMVVAFFFLLRVNNTFDALAINGIGGLSAALIIYFNLFVTAVFSITAGYLGYKFAPRHLNNP